MPDLQPNKTSSDSLQRLLSTTQAARYLGVTGATVRRLIYAGDLPVIRKFKHYKVDRVDLEKFVAAEKDVL
jgi:excisionase family DNA binding protein